MDRTQQPKPPNLPLALWLSPRCGAKTRKGMPCQCPAMPNGRCRIHGGVSPGAPKGNRNALKHGLYSAEAVANRRKVGALLRTARELVRQVDDCSTAQPRGERSP
jgi:glucans biosynthesis protein